MRVNGSLRMNSSKSLTLPSQIRADAPAAGAAATGAAATACRAQTGVPTSVKRTSRQESDLVRIPSSVRVNVRSIAKLKVPGFLPNAESRWYTYCEESSKEGHTHEIRC